MSFIERTAKKLYPILEELKKKMVREKKHKKRAETIEVDDTEWI